jgi:DNA-binding MarR family transcriptional regulator
VAREADPGDARGVRLGLTKAGRKVYEGLIGAAEERDAAFRKCLSSNESLVFDRALTKLATQARAFIREEKK